MLFKLLKYTALITFCLTTLFVLFFFWVLYEEQQVADTVDQLFNKNKYTDIQLIVCHEEKCLYDFGKGKEHIQIYTVGRDNIENRVELARDVAKNWPSMNSKCKTFYQGHCQL